MGRGGEGGGGKERASHDPPPLSICGATTGSPSPPLQRSSAQRIRGPYPFYADDAAFNIRPNAEHRY